MTELPPLVTDPARFRDGFIYIPRWDEFQHRDAVRSGPPMKWVKLHTALLDNPEYLDLPLGYRGLLVDLWLLTARMGNGRVSARSDLLMRWLGYDTRQIRKVSAEHQQSPSRAPAETPAELPHGYLQRGLKRLNHAGFLEVRASRMPAARQQPASTEERRVEGGPEGSPPSTIVGSKTARDRALGSAAPDALAAASTSPNGDEPLRNLEAELEHDREWCIGRIAQRLWTRSRFADVDDQTWHNLEHEADAWLEQHGIEMLAASIEPPPDTDEESI